LSRWAGAGYVVAAPDFPLSNGRAPGGPSFTDFVAQPGDMSFVITPLEQESSRPGSPLTGLLVLHGDSDETAPHAGGQAAFAGAAPPKFMVTLVGGSHSGPYVNTADRAFVVVVRTTVAFFDYFLKGDRSALDRLRRSGQVTGVAHEDAVSEDSAGPSRTTPSSAGVLPSGGRATASPWQGLQDGETIEVTWSGFPRSGVVNVLGSGNPPKGPDDCDLGRGLVAASIGLGGVGSSRVRRPCRTDWARPLRRRPRLRDGRQSGRFTRLQRQRGDADQLCGLTMAG
jgi:hypothetical protein